MKKEGLSPVIATVLLVAIVIVLGLIVFLWLKGITQEAITKFNGQNVELVCNNVQFDATYSSGSPGEIYLSNTGNVAIYQFKAQLSGAGTSDTIVVGSNDSNWPKYGLNSGKTYSGSLDLGSSTSLTIIPVLIGQTKSNGDQTYTCQNQGKEVSLS